MLKKIKYIIYPLLVIIVILFTLNKLYIYSLEKNTIYIPYQDGCGQPNKELVIFTINQLQKVKKLKYIYFKEKLFNKKRKMGYGIFDEDTLSKYHISLNNFTYERDNKIYGLDNIPIYDKSTNYLGFQFRYKNTSCKGLYLKYILFYDESKELKQKNEDYKYIKKLENNWYFMVTTFQNSDNPIFENIFISRDTNKKWEYLTPPLSLIIEPYNVDLINQWIDNINVNKGKK